MDDVMPIGLYDNSWQNSNAQGAAILQDAGISLGQLSSGSYQKMLDALENGSDFSFSKNSNGKYDVTTGYGDFWGNLLNGSSTGNFLGSLNGGQNKSSDNKEAPTNSFSEWMKKISDFVAYGPVGMGKVTPVDSNIIGGSLNTSTVDAITEKYGATIIRIILGVVGMILLVIGLIFMFKGEATKMVVGNVGKTLKGD